MIDVLVAAGHPVCVSFCLFDGWVLGKADKGSDVARLAQLRLARVLAALGHEHCLRIPMQPDSRSLNLSNAAALVLYEALRQLGFPGLG